MKFTEEKLEKAFIDLLTQEGFPHHWGIDISRPADEVLIEEDVLKFHHVVPRPSLMKSEHFESPDYRPYRFG